jgi:hypothetical protein
MAKKIDAAWAAKQSDKELRSMARALSLGARDLAKRGHPKYSANMHEEINAVLDEMKKRGICR